MALKCHLNKYYLYVENDFSLVAIPQHTHVYVCVYIYIYVCMYILPKYY